MVVDRQHVQAAADFRVRLLQTSCTVSPKANLMLQFGYVLLLQLETHLLSAWRSGDGEQVWELHDCATKTSCKAAGTSHFTGLDI